MNEIYRMTIISNYSFNEILFEKDFKWIEIVRYSWFGQIT